MKVASGCTRCSIPIA